LDNDGFGNEPVPVKLKITVKGDAMIVDLDGSAPQTKGSVNCGFTQTISAARLAFKLLINPTRPVDGGTFHTLKVAAPTNSIFNAQEPAACAWYFSSLGLLIDLFLKALAPVMPDRVAAAHYGDSMVISLNGIDSRSKGRFLTIEATTGGWGGWSTGDGQDSLINEVNGSFRDLPVEIFEHKYPARILQYSIRTDSGGAGKFRGGNGTVRKYLLLNDANLSLWFERSVTPAWGLAGGERSSAESWNHSHRRVGRWWWLWASSRARCAQSAERCREWISLGRPFQARLRLQLDRSSREGHKSA
jgi:N-methylhydantoinase B